MRHARRTRRARDGLRHLRSLAQGPRRPARQGAATDADTAFDYQLGGAYPPPAGVRAVSRDRRPNPRPASTTSATSTPSRRSPTSRHLVEGPPPRTAAAGEHGEPVIDEDWDEPLLDISTGAKRRPSWKSSGRGSTAAPRPATTRSNPTTSTPTSVPTAGSPPARRGLRPAPARRAHQRHLADRAEEHHRPAAAAPPYRLRLRRRRGVRPLQGVHRLRDAYAGRVFVIEYRKKDFTAACRALGQDLSLTLRDRDVRPAGAGATSPSAAERPAQGRPQTGTQPGRSPDASPDTAPATAAGAARHAPSQSAGDLLGRLADRRGERGELVLGDEGGQGGHGDRADRGAVGVEDRSGEGAHASSASS